MIRWHDVNQTWEALFFWFYFEACFCLENMEYVVEGGIHTLPTSLRPDLHGNANSNRPPHVLPESNNTSAAQASATTIVLTNRRPRNTTRSQPARSLFFRCDRHCDRHEVYSSAAIGRKRGKVPVGMRWYFTSHHLRPSPRWSTPPPGTRRACSLGIGGGSGYRRPRRRRSLPRSCPDCEPRWTGGGMRLYFGEILRVVWDGRMGLFYFCFSTTTTPAPRKTSGGAETTTTARPAASFAAVDKTLNFLTIAWLKAVAPSLRQHPMHWGAYHLGLFASSWCLKLLGCANSSWCSTAPSPRHL